MAFYESIFYGSGYYYGPSGTDVPQDLRFYRTNVDNVYVFHWGFDENFISPQLKDLEFELELDTVDTFDSSNKISYDHITAIHYQNGDVRKGFAVDVATRLDKTEQTWYARVKTRFTYVANYESLTDPSGLLSVNIIDVYNGTEITLTSSATIGLPDPTETSNPKSFAVLNLPTNSDQLTINVPASTTLDPGEGAMYSWNTSSLIWEKEFEFLIVAGDPPFPSIGDIWFDTTIQKFKTYDGSQIIVLGYAYSAWSQSLEFTILEKFEVEEAENILTNLPDYHVYGKEDLRKPVNQRNSNLYTVANMYGCELDQTKLENILAGTNNYISLCRDAQLYDNFGYYFNYRKPQSQEFVEYRVCLENLILGSLVGGTIDGIERVVRSFTGVSPTLEYIRSREDFFLNTIFETPPEAPDGIRTSFSTSSDYRIGSLQVLKNGNVLNPGTDFTENHATPGFDMTVAPLVVDLLQVFFDVGSTPDPVVFDISNTVTLTGTATFTNGSYTVTGSGTSFLTELNEGNLITDSTGFALGEVLNITSNIELTLKDPWIGSSGSSVIKKINFNGTRKLTGTVTFTNSDPNVSGSGTLFTSELVPNDIITDNNGTVTGEVLSILDDTNLVLKSAWSGSTGANINARKLIYEEPILWDKVSLSHGLIIRVHNPGQFDLDRSVIETLTTQLVPAHVEVYFEFD